jgi:hypothetical protein
MYRKEYGRFRQHLFRPNEFEAMWSCLDLLLSQPSPPTD